MTNDELELIISARVKEALEEERAAIKKQKEDQNILLDEYCLQNRIEKDNADINHASNILFLKKAWKKYKNNDPRWEEDKKLVAVRLDSIPRLIDYTLEKWEEQQEDL